VIVVRLPCLLAPLPRQIAVRQSLQLETGDAERKLDFEEVFPKHASGNSCSHLIVRAKVHCAGGGLTQHRSLFAASSPLKEKRVRRFVVSEV
jgi:hypothetical protein